MKLTILIPTLNEPFSIRKLKRLKEVLLPQIEKYPEVTYSINDAGRSMTIGEKRNAMIQNSSSEYFVFIDCDDMVTPDYLDEIMKGLESNPDVVTFCGWITSNMAQRKNWTIKLGSGYTEQNGHYYRWPNHLSVMRRSLVEHVRFPSIRSQEDYQWSKMIHDRKLLKTEHHIPKQLYHYDWISPEKRNA